MPVEPKMIDPTPPVEARPEVKPEVKAADPPANKPLVGAVEEPAKPEAELEAKPVEAKPGETKPGDEKPKDQSLVTSVEPSTPIAYEAFKLPDGMKLDEAEATKFTSILGAHKVPQEAAQELINLYVHDVQHLVEVQRDMWNRTQEDWKNSVRADPELGGNRIETVLKTANSLIQQYGGSSEEKTKLTQALSLTGAGNHPEIVRFLYRVGKALAEPKPVPAPSPSKPAPQSRSAARYGANGAPQQGT